MGIGTEAAIASLKYGFEKLELQEINACAHIDNIASNKILQKIGMQQLETFSFDGEEHYWYSIKK